MSLIGLVEVCGWIERRNGLPDDIVLIHITLNHCSEQQEPNAYILVALDRLAA